MTEHRQLTAAAPWVELVATTDDWDAADPALLTAMLNQLVLIRTFEECSRSMSLSSPAPVWSMGQHTQVSGRRAAQWALSWL